MPNLCFWLASNTEQKQYVFSIKLELHNGCPFMVCISLHNFWINYTFISAKNISEVFPWFLSVFLSLSRNILLVLNWHYSQPSQCGHLYKADTTRGSWSYIPPCTLTFYKADTSLKQTRFGRILVENIYQTGHLKCKFACIMLITLNMFDKCI